MIVAIGIPSPTNISVPTVAYAFTPTTPSVSVSGNQSISVATVAYTLTPPVPTATSTSAPPDVLVAPRSTRTDQRRLQHAPNLKTAIRTIVLAPANGITIDVPQASYSLDVLVPNTINNPGMVFLGADDGKWPPPRRQWSRPHPGRLLLVESGAVNIQVPTLAYVIGTPLPAVQVAGNQSVAVPVVAYDFTPTIPTLGNVIAVPPAAYVVTPTVPTGSTYTQIPCRVRAFRAGYVYNRYRKYNEVFDIVSPLDYSPYWLSFVQTPPADWQPFLDVYVLSVDIQRVRPLEQQEVMRLIRDPNGPYRRRR